MTETIRVGRRRIDVTHPDKALFARPRITKRDLARHYERVAHAMLPHVRGRPLALEAFPRGVSGPGYYLKSVPDHFPAGSRERASRSGAAR
jgi:bifunctional non-homologous end joining protein LigD